MKYEHLLGLPFRMGESDCLALASKFYADNYNINIADYARPNDWSSGALDLASLIANREGFEKITEWTADSLRPGDILCMTIGEGNTNHIAVYLGGREILHHLANRLSRVDPFERLWESVTNYVLRHPRVPFEAPVMDTISILEALRARYLA